MAGALTEGAQPEQSDGKSPGAEGTPAAAAALEVAARRRQYSTAHKLQIPKEADAAGEGDGVGTLLRREGLYSSNLSELGKAHAEGRHSWPTTHRAAAARPRTVSPSRSGVSSAGTPDYATSSASRS